MECTVVSVYTIESQAYLNTTQQHEALFWMDYIQPHNAMCLWSQEMQNYEHLPWDNIPFPTGESYEDDVIPIGLFSLATLWLKLDTHTWFGPWGNMSTTASACHACMHRSYVICIFRRFLMTGLPVPEYWSVACLTDWFLLTNIIQTLWFCFKWATLST